MPAPQAEFVECMNSDTNFARLDGFVALAAILFSISLLFGDSSLLLTRRFNVAEKSSTLPNLSIQKSGCVLKGRHPELQYGDNSATTVVEPLAPSAVATALS